MSTVPLVILAGPTAVGKTGAAIAICRAFGAEVLGADSVQVYRGLDIGSAKPSADEQAQARHHLVDVADPGEDFDAARFMALAGQAIAKMQGRGKRVLVAGGTGLYLRALLYGLAPTPPVDPALRAGLAADWEAKGPQAMHARLAELDPASAQRLHPNDRQRVLRALEVCLSAGEPLSEIQGRHGFAKPRYPHLLIGLERPREELNQRIAERCHAMWDQGLLAETKGIIAAGTPPEAKALQSLGYRHALMVLSGQATPNQALELMIRDTRAYAKRQMTWFRGMKGINWLQADNRDGITALISDVWPPAGQRGR